MQYLVNETPTYFRIPVHMYITEERELSLITRWIIFSY